MELTQSNILVTGANRGLGRALLDALLERGARRIYACVRSDENAAAIAGLRESRVVPLVFDVRDAEQVNAAAKRVSELDLLINNAGLLASTGLLSSHIEQIEDDFAVNYWGLLYMVRAFLPALEDSADAGIVNVLSVVSLASMPAIGGYSASKAAAHSLTQALRGELAPRGVRVHGVYPGPIDTDMVRDFPGVKTGPRTVARALLDGVARGEQDVFPDPVAVEYGDTFMRDPKALERRMAT